MGSENTDNAGPPVPQIVEAAYGLYPGQKYFSGDYDAQDYCDWVDQSNGDPLPAPLAVYVRDCEAPHTAANNQRASRIRRAVEQELRLQGALFDADRPVQQLIFTDNIASAWTDDQLYGLVSAVQDSFTMDQAPSRWCACLGTTGISQSRLRLLQVLGFLNIRFSLRPGADAAVRHGMLEGIVDLGGQARELGLRQIMVDLYFNEAAAAFSRETLATCFDSVRPELVRLVEEGRGAATDVRSQQRDAYAELLATLGYANIGLDWFVRDGDAGGGSFSAGQLHWSLLGFTDMPRPDVVGVGPGAVSTIGDFYSQNEHRPDVYEELVRQGRIPTVRGLELESDDRLRREIMTMLVTESAINVSAVEDKWGIQFDQFFSQEIKQLRGYQEAGWVANRGNSIAVMARGRRELSELCRIFDRRIRMEASQNAPSFA